MKNIKQSLLILLLVLTSLFTTSCSNIQTSPGTQSDTLVSIEDIPEYTGEPYIEINQNQPDFTEEELTAESSESYEMYSEQDSLGRCNTAEACIGTDLMPTEERGTIGQVKPSGWQTVKYNDLIDGNYLYNRCHLIGYQLTGENANENNLITGTRYLNVQGMLPFENEVAEYISETSNHVLYRVTPIYQDHNLVASGVQMEAISVEDEGAGIQFNVYCYNVQPGIEINYATGESCRSEDKQTSSSTADSNEEYENTTDHNANEVTYIVNINTRKFHQSNCSSVKEMKEKNKKEFTGNRDALISQGIAPCDRCRP